MRPPQEHLPLTSFPRIQMFRLGSFSGGSSVSSLIAGSHRETIVTHFLEEWKAFFNLFLPVFHDFPGIYLDAM